MEEDRQSLILSVVKRRGPETICALVLLLRSPNKLSSLSDFYIMQRTTHTQNPLRDYIIFVMG